MPIVVLWHEEFLWLNFDSLYYGNFYPFFIVLKIPSLAQWLHVSGTSICAGNAELFLERRNGEMSIFIFQFKMMHTLQTEDMLLKFILVCHMHG